MSNTPGAFGGDTMDRNDPQVIVRVCREIDEAVATGEVVTRLQLLADVARNPAAHRVVRMRALSALNEVAIWLGKIVIADLPDGSEEQKAAMQLDPRALPARLVPERGGTGGLQ